MTRTRKKKGIIHIKIPRKFSAQDSSLIEKILDSLKAFSASVKYEKDSLRIEYYASNYMLKDIEYNIRKIIKEFYQNTDTETNENRIILSHELAKHLKHTIPLDPIIYILKYEGYEARKVKNGLETNASTEFVNKVAHQVAVLKNKLEDYNLSKKLRNLLLILMYLDSEKEASQLIQELITNGFIVKKNDLLTLNGEIKKIICKLYLTRSDRIKSMRVCGR